MCFIKLPTSVDVGRTLASIEHLQEPGQGMTQNELHHSYWGAELFVKPPSLARLEFFHHRLMLAEETSRKFTQTQRCKSWLVQLPEENLQGGEGLRATTETDGLPSDNQSRMPVRRRKSPTHREMSIKAKTLPLSLKESIHPAFHMSTEEVESWSLEDSKRFWAPVVKPGLHPEGQSLLPECHTLLLLSYQLVPPS